MCNRHDIDRNNMSRRDALRGGLQTGYVRASGFNLVATVNRGHRRLIVRVIGGNS